MALNPRQSVSKTKRTAADDREVDVANVYLKRENKATGKSYALVRPGTSTRAVGTWDFNGEDPNNADWMAIEIKALMEQAFESQYWDSELLCNSIQSQLPSSFTGEFFVVSPSGLKLSNADRKEVIQAVLDSYPTHLAPLSVEDQVDLGPYIHGKTSKWPIENNASGPAPVPWLVFKGSNTGQRFELGASLGPASSTQATWKKSLDQVFTPKAGGEPKWVKQLRSAGSHNPVKRVLLLDDRVFILEQTLRPFVRSLPAGWLSEVDEIFVVRPGSDAAAQIYP
ncbi:hypothetical protein GKN94_05410 [Candidatus Lucifugimonas marina]|uniref:hypothetical protein n=1 Tax=Candidatus Lucifugimonas marina TaxID=3038979 RepID=UPI0027A8E46C|nr:hypothetical protein GKN94_05410 [SAR202 cluster bacterium JH545]